MSNKILLILYRLLYIQKSIIITIPIIKYSKLVIKYYYNYTDY